jgi:hypothetical protein
MVGPARSQLPGLLLTGQVQFFCAQGPAALNEATPWEELRELGLYFVFVFKVAGGLAN